MKDSTNITLYDYWRSSASYRVRIALNLKGLAYEAIKVDLLHGAHQSATYLARNPQGTVPMLEIDGLCLTQSLAILEYLEETRPTPALLPKDAAARARVRRLALVIVADTHPVQNLNVAEHVMSLTNGTDADKQAWMQHFITRSLVAYEQLLADAATGRFSHGSEVTMADICLVPQIYNARRWGVDMEQFPSIVAVVEACDDIEAFALAVPELVNKVVAPEAVK